MVQYELLVASEPTIHANICLLPANENTISHVFLVLSLTQKHIHVFLSALHATVILKSLSCRVKWSPDAT